MKTHVLQQFVQCALIYIWAHLILLHFGLLCLADITVLDKFKVCATLSGASVSALFFQ